MGFGKLVGSDVVLCGAGNMVCRAKEVTIEQTPYEIDDITIRATIEREKWAMPGLAIYGGYNGRKFAAEKVVFNPPATVVYWADKTRTVVKCGKDDEYNREAGLALCYMKKALGNKSGTFNKALKKAEKEG